MIRKLTVKDRKKLSSLILKLVSKFDRKELIQLISSESSKDVEEKDDSKFVTFAIGVMKNIVDSFDTEVTEWFADLCGLSIDAFEKLPFDTEMKIIKLIAEAEETAGFFGQDSAIAKAIKSYLDTTRKKMQS